MTSTKKGILERLAESPVIGDGSTVLTLEKRGYATAGHWTTEAVVEYPEAVIQLQREYLRAGSDVIQTASFSSSDDKLCAIKGGREVIHTSESVNEAACSIARKVANEGNALVCGSLSPVASFHLGKSERVIREEFEKQAKVYEKYDVDFVMAEFFSYVEELEIAVDVLKRLKKPIAATMRTGLLPDKHGIEFEEYVIRMAKSGADIIGMNCQYDTNTYLKIMKKMKHKLDEEGLHPYLMCQPNGFLCPEAEDHLLGYTALPEYPFALEPRNITRIEAHKFARAAWDIGVRYIGGCCGFEPHHIRAMAQELAPERGRIPAGQEKHPPFGGAPLHDYYATSPVGDRSTREYWYSFKPGSGRPFNAPLSNIANVRNTY